MNNNIKDQLISEISLIRKKGGNLQIIKKKIGEDRLKEFIHSIYPKFSITEIEAITGIPDSTLGYWFKQLNIPFIRHHITNMAIPGDKEAQFVISEGGVTKKVSTIKITPELAYIIGFTLGDGNIQRFMIDVFNKDEKLREYLFRLLKPYGSITEERRENGLWRLRLSSVKIANLIKDEKGIRQDTLDYIFGNDDLARQFIAAFWDAEGSIGRRSNYFDIILYNSNIGILSRIRKFLDDKEIHTSLKYFKETRKVYFIGKRKVKAKHKVLRIRVLKNSFGKWADIIGVYLLHSRKNKMVSEMLNIYGGNTK